MLAKAGEKVLSGVSNIQIKSVELYPMVDDRLFSNIPFKTGVKVYEIKHGQITDSYVEGATREKSALK